MHLEVFKEISDRDFGFITTRSNLMKEGDIEKTLKTGAKEQNNDYRIEISGVISLPQALPG